MKINPQAIVFILALSIFGPITTVAEASSKTTTEFFTQAESEAKVRTFFKDTPVMTEIARCESEFRQYTDNGNVLRGGSANGMIGVFQFFESIHTPIAKELGFDLATLDGNLAYAKHLFQSEGTNPWEPARSCWDLKPKITKPATTLSTARTTKIKEQIAVLMKLIATLQKQLESQQRLK
jgi:flagellar capping protein FliD